MTNYDSLKSKAEGLESRVRHGRAYRDNLQSGVIVTSAVDNGPYSGGTGKPFLPHLSNRTAGSYGSIDTDQFSEEEMHMLKVIVCGYVARIEAEYKEVLHKLEAIEVLLS